MPPRARTPTLKPALPESPAGEADSPDLVEQATPVPEPDSGGWFRNTGSAELTVLGDGITAVLAPGRITELSRTPTHRDLEAAGEADYVAQQAADEAAEAAKTAAETQSADVDAPTTDETEA